MAALSCSLMTVSGEIVLIHVSDDADRGRCRGGRPTILAPFAQLAVVHGMCPAVLLASVAMARGLCLCFPFVLLPRNFRVELNGPIGAVLPCNRNIGFVELIDAQSILREAEVDGISISMMLNQIDINCFSQYEPSLQDVFVSKVGVTE